MPRRTNAPTTYQLKEPVVAMQVTRPYAAVAEWCGGKVFTTQPGNTVVGIQINGYLAKPGDYIAHMDDVFIHIKQQYFENTYARTESK